MANTGTQKSGIDKNVKYDRQIRLWGDHGQAALELARVCLIHATATGTEILKNLILPGIGSYTIVDGHKIQGEDIGNNFFLTKDALGKSRAQIAAELLAELNEDVSGDFVEEFPEALLQNNPDFFNSFTIVIATDLCERTLLQLASHLWANDIPLLVCRCYGFIGYMRLVVKEHPVVESHPDSAHENLRLDRPFPGLIKLCDGINLNTMTNKEHSHTPWLIVLYKYLQEWKKTHNGEPPKNYKEKNELKQMIREAIRKNEDGVPEEEENFDEAIKSVNTALVPTQVSSEVRKLFEDPECKNLHQESKPFWILLKAVKMFVEKEGHGMLPLRGTIPDMTADSERYIQLQQAYIDQAAQDITVVTEKLQDILQSIGRDEPLRPEFLTKSASLQSGYSISEQEIKTFCRNAGFLRLVRCRSIAEEFDPKTAKIQEIATQVEDEEHSDVVFYILLRAVDKFFEEYNHYPGWYDDQIEGDVLKLKTCLNKMLHDLGVPPVIKDDYTHEICRYGAAELHTVASFIGGAAAQEAIKIISGQFVPINNTFIYNAMRQTSITLEL